MKPVASTAIAAALAATSAPIASYAQQNAQVAANSPSAAEGQIRAATQEMLDAVAPGNASVWEKYLDPKLTHIDETGTRRTKKELVAEMTPLPPGLKGTLKIDRFNFKQFGDWAIADVEVQEGLDYFGQQLHGRFRSLDTWRWTKTGWRLMAQQVSAVLKDPPAAPFPLQPNCEYAGTYRLTATITSAVKCVDGGLASERSGRPAVNYKLESGDVFFSPGQPRTRRIFLRDGQGKITAFVDRREGEDIRWTREP